SIHLIQPPQSHFYSPVLETRNSSVLCETRNTRFSRVITPEDCIEQGGKTGELLRHSTHGEFLASETEPFSDAATSRACVARTMTSRIITPLHFVESIFGQSRDGCGVQEFYFVHASFHLFNTTGEDPSLFHSV